MIYLDASIKKYLEDAAAKLPAPGGGSVAALSGALGAAMSSMVANFTAGKEKYKEVEGEIQTLLARSEALRKELEQLIDKDVEAYQKVSAAYKLPRESTEDKEKRTLAIEGACRSALEVPLQIAQCGKKVLEINKHLVEIGNAGLVSDVGVAVILACASVEAGVLNVEINLSSLKDKAFVSEKRDILITLLREGASLKEEVLKKVKNKINS